jgi:WD40 repeat protein
MLAASNYTAGVSVRQLTSQERLWQAAGNEIAFALAGSRLAVCNGRTVEVGDLETRQLLQSFPEDYGSPEMALSPDGALFAVGWCVEGGMWCDLSRVFLYEVATGQQAGVWEVPTGIIQVLSSPDGGIIAVGADDGFIRLWFRSQLLCPMTYPCRNGKDRPLSRSAILNFHRSTSAPSGATSSRATKACPPGRRAGLEGVGPRVHHPSFTPSPG